MFLIEAMLTLKTCSFTMAGLGTNSVLLSSSIQYVINGKHVGEFIYFLS
jgi:hypothetical protein